jgi:hypothetical protein
LYVITLAVALVGAVVIGSAVEHRPTLLVALVCWTALVWAPYVLIEVV